MDILEVAKWIAVGAVSFVGFTILFAASLGGGGGVQPKGDPGPMPKKNGRKVVFRPEDM